MKSLEAYKNIFFDRDGIINEIIIRENNIVSSPRVFSEFVIRDEFINFFNKLKKDKYFFVVTNQPDISRGLLDRDQLVKMHNELINKFTFNKIVFCPHDNYHNCNCRKPKSGMVDSIIKEFSLNKDECLIIGDSAKDADCGISAGIDYVLLLTLYNTNDIKMYNNGVKCLDDIF